MSKPLKIYVKPHLKKFILKHHPGKQPLYADERSPLGAAIMHVLMEVRKSKFENIIHHHTECILVTPTVNMARRSPRQYKLVRVAVEMERVFRQAIIVWVSAQQEAGLPANQACKNFLEHYGIDEGEFSYDGVYKCWQRHKDEQKAIKKSPKRTNTSEEVSQ
jgi:hypothetical protein